MTEIHPFTGPSDAQAASLDPRRDQALDVLVQAISQLQQESADPPTASEVHVRMRSLTYGGFRYSELGYKRFRDFLVLGEERGLIQVDRTRTGDIGVSLTSDAVPPFASHAAIRPDLWRAAVDWTPGLLRIYELAEDKVHLIPERQAPLEPERIAQTRARYEKAPDEFTVVPNVEIQTQLTWMREFAESLSLSA